jgi:hypothetical protein
LSCPSLSIFENYDETVRSIGWQGYYNYYVFDFEKGNDLEELFIPAKQ